MKIIIREIFGDRYFNWAVEDKETEKPLAYFVLKQDAHLFSRALRGIK